MRSEPYFHLLGLPMGPPQFVAAFLLLCFLAQCAVLSATTESVGLLQPGFFVHPKTPGAPIVGILAGVAITFGRMVGLGDIASQLAKLPFIAIGLLLGASIWYVARRLYGNPGGIAALLLYCFSPMPFVSVSMNPIPVAALGMFGVIFVSIAVSHTLYAPARSSMWGEIRQRWRRVAMLGTAIALMAGAAPELSFMVLVALAMMFYLVPHRRGAALGLMASGLAVAIAILVVIAGPRWFAETDFSPFAGWSAPHFVVHTSVAAASWTLMTIAAASAGVYLASRRSRYFGNTAPLLATALTLVLGLPSSGDAYLGPFPAWSLPLLFVFVGGIFADLAETSWRRPAVLVFVVLAASLATLELLAVAQHPWGRRQELPPPPGVRRIRIGTGVLL
ncbi:MAG TPA: hypothetical protein VMS96_12520 [Terriglobales bacterium]|nr:hypothetical protein [Terriglobales bacterium]